MISSKSSSIDGCNLADTDTEGTRDFGLKERSNATVWFWHTLPRAIRWNEMLRFKCDIDCGLSELLHNRILWHESRFCFEQKRDKNLGGNSRFRSPERIEAEKRYLQKKWQAHILIDQYQSQDRVKVKVERKQSGDL